MNSPLVKRGIVYHRSIKAGILEKSEEGFRFRYLPEYLSHPDAESVSLTLPLGLLRFQYDSLCYVIKRFDRLDEGTKYPQEDFQQLTGIDDKNSGYMERVGKVLLEYSSAPLLDVVILFERLLSFAAYMEIPDKTVSTVLDRLNKSKGAIKAQIDSSLLPQEEKNMFWSICEERLIRFFIFPLFFLLSLIYPSDSFAKSNWRLVPSLTVSETYISNISSTTEEVDDYFTKLGGSVSAIYNGPSLGLRGTYLANFNSYAAHPEENVVTQDGSLHIDLNRWFQGFVKKKAKLVIKENFTYTSDLADYSFDEEQGEISSLSNYGIRTRRSDSFRNAFAISMSRPITKRATLSTSYSNLLTEFKDPELRDNISSTVEFGISHSFPKDAVYGNLSVSNIRQEKEDSKSYSFVLGIRHAFSPLMSFGINTGVVAVDHETSNSASTFRGSLSLSRRSRNHVYHAGYSRSLNTVSGISGVLTTADIFYINLTNMHTAVLTSTIGTNYAINTSLNGSEADINSYNISASLNYIIMTWLRSSLAISHFKQNTDVSTAITQDTQRDMITLTLIGAWN